MSLTPSTMVALGSLAPDFLLNDLISLEPIGLKSFKEKKVLLVMFICRHCPYVVHVKHEIAKLAEDYKNKSMGIVAISSNDAQNYPEDAPDKLREMAKELKFDFPFCYDEAQSVAKEYKAACTPDFFVYDEARRLCYRGQLDDSRPGNSNPITGKDLRFALDAVLEGHRVSGIQKPSLGCNIKWKNGCEPDYFNR